jgi:hypothetical protein
VAYGVLRFRQTATLEGTPLSPTDLVVLDRVPNDVAMVAGIITGEFQTPLAHVAVLAQTRGTPNMALRDAWTDPRLRALADQLVRLEVGPQAFTIAVGDPAEAQAYWDSLRPPALQLPVHDSTTLPLFDVTRATVANVVQIGAKASNLGELYTIGVGTGHELPLPERPLAIPFAHYANHLAAAGVGPLLDAVLTDYAAGTLTPAQLEARLFAIRWRIYTAPIDPALVTQVATLARARWPEPTRLRFRSSTNVEDLAEFTGAGLYTSAGAALVDGEAALANAIKVVWASAWNAQAFVERDFYRVAQREVRMAVLIHPAQDDELANGVALTINQFSERRPAFYINSQLGEVSVTNPTGGATPEQLLYYTWYEEPEYEVITRSSLMGWAVDWPSPVGVLTDAELDELAGYLTDINARLRVRYPGAAADVEWKLLPGRRPAHQAGPAVPRSHRDAVAPEVAPDAAAPEARDGGLAHGDRVQVCRTLHNRRRTALAHSPFALRDLERLRWHTGCFTRCRRFPCVFLSSPRSSASPSRAPAPPTPAPPLSRSLATTPPTAWSASRPPARRSRSMSTATAAATPTCAATPPAPRTASRTPTATTRPAAATTTARATMTAAMMTAAPTTAPPWRCRTPTTPTATRPRTPTAPATTRPRTTRRQSDSTVDSADSAGDDSVSDGDDDGTADGDDCDCVPPPPGTPA